jgi:uncharacterized membrane protein YdcZ (DUF606 family)
MMAAAISFFVGARPRGGGASGPRGRTAGVTDAPWWARLGVLGTFYVSFLLILTCETGPTNTATFVIAG